MKWVIPAAILVFAPLVFIDGSRAEAFQEDPAGTAPKPKKIIAEPVAVKPEVASVAKLADRPGPHWVWMSDFSLGLADGRYVLMDAGSGKVLGMLSTGWHPCRCILMMIIRRFILSKHISLGEQEVIAQTLYPYMTRIRSNLLTRYPSLPR